MRDSLMQLRNGKGDPIFSTDIRSDDYLQFIIHILKPRLDRQFRTIPSSESTYLMGSSMGGLISMYGVCEYPEVFGGAACMSTHWPGVYTNENNPIPTAFMDYLKNHLPAPGGHRLYIPHQPKVDAIFRNAGYGGQDFKSKCFPGHKHEERFWRQRLAEPLTFLFSEQ